MDRAGLCRYNVSRFKGCADARAGMSVVTRNLRIFIMERKPNDIGEMSELAAQYFEVHGNTYIFANVGKHRHNRPSSRNRHCNRVRLATL